MNKVLVIDDQPELRQLFQKVLESQGYSVTAAENGQTGLVALETFSAQLILLDMAMPVMDGMTFLRALRHKPGCEHIPVLILSGLMSSEQIQTARTLGAADQLIKADFTMKELRSRVAHLLLPTLPALETTGTPACAHVGA